MKKAVLVGLVILSLLTVQLVMFAPSSTEAPPEDEKAFLESVLAEQLHSIVGESQLFINSDLNGFEDLLTKHPSLLKRACFIRRPGEVSSLAVLSKLDSDGSEYLLLINGSKERAKLLIEAAAEKYTLIFGLADSYIRAGLIDSQLPANSFAIFKSRNPAHNLPALGSLRPSCKGS